MGELRNLDPFRAIRRVVAPAAAVLVFAACSGDKASPEAASDTPPTTIEALFEIANKWSLPAPVVVGTKTEEICLFGDASHGVWFDEDGKRRPAVQENPLIVTVDGSCNTPLEDTRVGVYHAPEQVGKAPVVVSNGDSLGVECYVLGMPIPDIRGSMSASDVWLGVITASGKLGLIPETNVGFVDEIVLKTC